MAPPGGEGTLRSVQITDDAAGVRRGVWEYVESYGVGDGEVGIANEVSVELIGGSREVPVARHPKFQNISDDDKEKIDAAAEAKNPDLLPDNMGDAFKAELYELYRRKVFYYAEPNVVGRVTRLESALPQLGDLLTLGGDSNLPSAPSNTVWLMTGISAREVGGKYEVTREYTLSGDGAQVANFLYGT